MFLSFWISINWNLFSFGIYKPHLPVIEVFILTAGNFDVRKKLDVFKKKKIVEGRSAW